MSETSLQNSTAQPISAHLSALRGAFIRIAIAVGITGTGCFAFAPKLFKLLTLPYTRLLRVQGNNTTVFLQTLDPAETLKLSFTLAFVLGAAFMIPYVLYEVWKFVQPGLTGKERKWLLPVVISGTALFIAGVSFAFFVVIPFMLDFFWTYSLSLGVMPAWTFAHYINFMLGTLVAFGIAFELPVATSILAVLGIINAAQLVTARRYAIFIICVLSAVLTPSDVMSMVLMAVPLILLYEVAIILARLIGRRKSRD